MKKLISLVLTLVFLLIVAVAGYYLYTSRQNELASQRALDAANAAANPLEIERRELRSQLDNIKREMPSPDADIATVQLIFCTADDVLYNDIFPAMQERGLTGTIALSSAIMPGSWKKISWTQFQEMMDAGWSYCVAVDSKWTMDAQEKALKQQKLEPPDTVYFAPEAYSTELDETLSNYRYVIHHGEDALPFVVYDFEEEGLVHLGAKPWNYAGVRQEIADLLNGGGNLAFTISTGKKGDDLYKSGGFLSLLDYLVSFRKDQTMPGASEPNQSDRLVVCSAEGANELHANREALYAARYADWKAKLDAVQAKYDELTEQISHIYASWRTK